MAYTSIIVSSFSPFGTVVLSLPSETPIAQVPEAVGCRIGLDIRERDLALELVNRPLVLDEQPISTLHDEESSMVTLRLVPRLRGGKGGFGSQLRAAGGRMSSQKTSNNDSCRDLNGRRLSTVKEAKRLAQYMEEEPLRKKAELETKKAKLEALEKQLGITPPENTSTEAGPSGSRDEKGKGREPEQVAGKKHRFDDTEYLEQSEAIVDNVKSAVAAALLKKRKKARTEANAPPPSLATTSSSASKDAPMLTDKDKVAEPKEVAAVEAAA